VNSLPKCVAQIIARRESGDGSTCGRASRSARYKCTGATTKALTRSKGTKALKKEIVGRCLA
jgi:hypothetical protein